MILAPGESLILCYHGVTLAQSQGHENASGKHMPMREFIRQLAALNRTGLVKPLATAVAEGGIAITFDDSYANVFENAVMLLRGFDMPATFFITTGMVDNPRKYWTDRVESAVRTEDVAAIKSALKQMPKALRHAFLRIMSLGQDAENYRTATWAQVKDAANDPLFVIGGHGNMHDPFTTLTPDECADDIDRSLAALHSLTRIQPTVYSYPEGMYDDTCIELLKRRGITICPAATPGINKPGDDPFKLHRYMPGFMGQRFPLDE